MFIVNISRDLVYKNDYDEFRCFASTIVIMWWSSDFTLGIFCGIVWSSDIISFSAAIYRSVVRVTSTTGCRIACSSLSHTGALWSRKLLDTRVQETTQQLCSNPEGIWLDVHVFCTVFGWIHSLSSSVRGLPWSVCVLLRSWC